MGEKRRKICYPIAFADLISFTHKQRQRRPATLQHGSRPSGTSRSSLLLLLQQPLSLSQQPVIVMVL